VATLDIPACPEGNLLTVNAVTTELDGGRSITQVEQAGAALSLVEAIQIAANRPEADTIRFDATIFPPHAPARIVFEGTTFGGLNGDCLDARDVGVVVEWTDANGPENTWSLTNSLMVGLSLVNLPVGLSAQDGSQIAGCRFLSGRFDALSTTNSTAGPGNVFANVTVGVQAYGNCVVRENSFGFDPSTRAISAGAVIGLQLFSSDAGQVTTVSDNLFVGTSQAMSVPFGSSSPKVEIVGNEIRPATSGGIGGGIHLNGAHGAIGPGNHIYGLSGPFAAIALADDLDSASTVTITQNSIHDNLVGIAYATAPPVAPPQLTAWDGATLSGTCPVAGLAELFLDHGPQGEIYLGSVLCNESTIWTVGYPRSALPTGTWNFTATLTDNSARTSEFSTPLPAL